MSRFALCRSSLAIAVAFTAALAFVPGLTTGPAVAQVLLLKAVDSGTYSWLGDHTASNENYATGNVAPPTWLEYRSFFVFNLSGVTGTILNAALEAYNPGNPPNAGDGYQSPDLSETFALFDVVTPVATLVAGGSGLTAIFDDLGSGSGFGSLAMSAANNATLVHIDLNATAVASLNAAAGLWATGGALTSIGGQQEIVFSFTGAPEYIRRLALEIENLVFADTFDFGDTSAWSDAVGGT